MFHLFPTGARLWQIFWLYICAKFCYHMRLDSTKVRSN